jgi:phosphatidylglycerophosphatase A
MTFSRQTVMFLATGGFVGNLPLAPGTFGSLLGLPVCFFLTKLPAAVSAIFIGLFTIAAVGIAGQAETMLTARDPGSIVIDEVAGQLVALFGLPFNFPVVAGGFLVFRCLDIVKPFPIRWLERRLSGGFGIVADDILAGLAANLIIRFILFIWP